MARVVKFPVQQNQKKGYKRVRKRKKVNLEDYGQLNIFKTQPSEAKVIKMTSHSSDFEFALSLDENGDFEKAKEYYWLSIKNNDSPADAYCNLGILESEVSNYAKAIDHLTQALKHDPRHYEAHYNLGNAYSEVNNYSLAKVHFELVLEIEPEFSSAYYNLGLVLATLKEFDKAIAVLKKYKLLIDDDHAHINDLINSLQKTIL